MSEDSDKTIQSQGISLSESEATIRDDVTPLRRRPQVGFMLLGRYEVLSELGQGGMGVVYRCLDRTSGTEVAVKALPPELSHSPAEMEEVRENYKLVSGLFHPNIAACRTLDMDPATGDYYLVMEFVDGEQLKMWMQRTHPDGKVPLKETMAILRQVAEALDYAHQRKIMHRDIKPSNIMVQADGTVKVLDFGLAAQIQSSMSRVSTAVTSQSGTRQYKSPEQWQGLAQGASSDQYALAATAYEMLSGHVPFDDNDAAVLREMVLKENPSWIKGVASYANLALSHGLAKTPSERYASCMDFIRALGGEKVDLKGSENSASHLGKVAAVLVVIIGLVAVGMAYHRYVGTSRSDVAEKTDEELRAESEKKATEELASRKQHAEDEKWLRERRVNLKVEVDALTEKVRTLRNDSDAELGKQFDAFENYLKLAVAAGAEDPGIAVENYEAAKKEAERLMENIPFQKTAAEQMTVSETIKNEALKFHADQHARDAYYLGLRKDAEGRKEYENGLYKAALNNFETAVSSFTAAQKYAKEMQLAEIDQRVAEARKKHDWKGLEKCAEEYHVYDTGQVERLKQEAIEGRRIDVQEANMKLAREAVTAAREAGKVGKWKDVIDNLNRVNSLLELSPEMIALKFLAEQELQKEKDNLLEQLESEKVTEFVEAINEDDKEKPCIRIKAMLDGEEVEATLVGTEKKTPLRGNKFEIGSILAGELKFGKGENNYIGFFKERIDWHGLKEVTVELKKFVFTGVVTLPKGVTLELIKVEAGSFVMGSPASEKGRRNDEKQHHVTLTQDYWLGKYEVTQAQYEALMGTNPSTKMVEVNCPVVEVSWNDAMEFCRLLTQREQWAERLPKGYEYTLPTEAQWEYAARGGHKASGYHIYSGGDNLKDLGWYNVNSEYTLKSVGLKCPNELGLYDMSGNALEWCYDWIDSYPSDSVTDPCVTVPSGGRVLRGGSNTTIEDSCRSSHRAYVMPAVPGESFGFRLALAPVKTTNKNEEAKYSNIIESSNNKDETISDISAKIVMLPNDVPLELVRVKAGSFMMGNAQHDNEQQPWEKPHQVTLTRDYWIGKYEVTQRQYEAIMNNNPSEICKGEHYPVENVTWENAMLFCRLLTQREREAGRLPDGYEYTLPTEAQWEFAARGGKKSKGYVYSGSNDYETVAWLHKNANATTHPVGQKQANELGLYDMSGNVEEWCRDWYEDDYAKDCEFLYDNQGKQHVMRGGHIHAFFPLYSRTSGRLERYPVDSGMNTGFRVALVYNPSTSLSLLSATSFGKSIKVTLPGGALLELVRIHAGGFMMGSPENESGRERDEKTHSVKLTKDYWIGKYEVTQGQWKAVMGISLDEKAQQINSISGENRAGKVGDEYPMFLVNWEDALEFCRKLTEYERISGLLPDGYEYTLPTEAQWEFAARGGRRSKHCKYSGSNDSNTVAWTSENSEWRLHPVGTKSPNELGIYDMSGNVYEMCLDQCAGNYNTKILKEMNMLDLIDDNGISRNLVITDTYRDGILDPYCRNAHEHIRVTRGGSFNYSDNKARVADRNQCECHGYYSDLGFRVVLSALPSETEKQGNTEQSSEPKTQQMPETIIDEPTKKESTVNTRTIILPNNVALELVKVKAGSFMMGSPESETGQGVDEIQHRVELTKDFWIGKYEVTQAQYEAVMGNNPAYFKKGSNYPVERVSWFDAMFFCKKLTEREQSIGEVPNGYEFTLPTEAQWEYAARGGHKSSGYHVYAGSDSIVFVTWYEKNSGRTTHPVGQKHANELKVYDMSGNVFEWCRDWYSSEKHSSTVDPVGSSSGLRRVRRGGSWNSMSWNCRLVFRSDSSPSSRENFNGFRVVLAPVQ